MRRREIRRYSEAFKLQVISELESGALKSQYEARVRYDIRGASTIPRWIRQYGKERLLRKVVRVETTKEKDQLKEMKKRIRDLEHALAGLPEGEKPIHHSDRGSNYCSHRFVDMLTANGCEVSMTEVDHCAENALAERVNGILKQEYGMGQKFPTKKHARKALKQAVYLYNYRRPHNSLGNRFPGQVHAEKAA